MKSNIPLIYLLGAGRSGTTLLATVLNAHHEIQTIGEMHQFFDFIREDRPCSCGQKLQDCTFWQPVLESIIFSAKDIREKATYSESCEKHRNIPKLILSSKLNRQYLHIHEPIFEAITRRADKQYLLDSSKYLARYILLSRSSLISIKGIYVVRDVRGLIHSFAKKVQTPKSPMATIAYYLLINFFAEIMFRTDKKILKVRYEDFVEDPARELNRIYMHVFGKPESGTIVAARYDMPHIIGGNRMKAQKQVGIRKDQGWETKFPLWKKWVYYVLAFPVMVINRYKP